ncbi:MULTISPECIES: ABC transporter ATP-binding protein [unclassified Methanoculleus]|jgi:iron complex transport system ATP-binding protein|uniref:ABC transporter ATP-binding protein n=1 Tax=unclassified Methanoculleus TaxID=2619537 RepID=UPI0025CC280C|nr:ABC transporter ATP-binding protein [Methanoculleus sp. UBA377]MDD2474043.1 ABC transporter ATP-binding protein [Methanoculleus sp.]
MTTLDLDNVGVSFGNNIVLEEITTTFKSGEMTAVIGRNGIGKTTLLKAIGNQIKRTGTITFDDGNARALSFDDISYVPQMSSTQTRLTVFEMVLIGLLRDLRWKVTLEQIQAVTGVLGELNILHLSEQPFFSLSGGQRQLVILAQALVSRPKILLLDEPTSALDLRHQLIIMDLARNYTHSHDVITIYVVHDLNLAARYSDSIILLHDAKIRAHGTADEVLRSELLEAAYNVRLDIEKTGAGYLTITPIEPL